MQQHAGSATSSAASSATPSHDQGPAAGLAAGSQFDQDTFLDRWVFEGCRDGTFLDVGAGDGVHGSNTLLLERDRGWTGLLVEPLRPEFELALDRRSSPCLNVAVGPASGTAEFLEVVTGYRAMGGLVADYPERMLGVVRRHPDHQERVIEVPVIEPTELVERLGTTTIDLISIDIEGAELGVLVAFPFDRAEVGVWCVENNAGTDEIELMLASHGYGLVRRLGPDEIYVASHRVSSIRAAAGIDDFDEAVELIDGGYLPHAQRVLEQLALREPDHGDVWTNLGAVRRSQGDLVGALEAQRNAHAQAPTHASVRRNLQRVLLELGHPDEAGRLGEAVTDPTDDDRLLAARARVEAASLDGDVDVAITACADWAAIDGHESPATLERAGLLLSIGDFDAGFAAYESRRDVVVGFPHFPHPEWTGESLRGKHLLVVGEQGLGDHVFFARYLSALRRFEPTSVTIACREPVRRLLGSCDGVDAAVAPEPEALRFPVDRWVPFGSLPRIIGGTPAPARFALPDDSVQRARRLVTGDLRIGLVWSGNTAVPVMRRRHASLDDLRPLFDAAPASWFSLAKNAAGLDDPANADLPIVDLATSDRDLADTAAVIAELDLVITVCTMTAHLAPTVSTPTWVMLHERPFWTWGRGNSAWYPDVRQYHQREPGEWAHVVEAVADDLTVWARRRTGRAERL